MNFILKLVIIATEEQLRQYSQSPDPKTDEFSDTIFNNKSGYIVIFFCLLKEME